MWGARDELSHTLFVQVDFSDGNIDAECGLRRGVRGSQDEQLINNTAQEFQRTQVGNHTHMPSTLETSTSQTVQHKGGTGTGRVPCERGSHFCANGVDDGAGDDGRLTVGTAASK